MKKLVLCLLFGSGCLVSGLFAAGSSWFSLNLSFPFVWEDADDTLPDYLDMDASMRTANLAVGASFSSYFTERIGLHAALDFYFPRTYTVTVDSYYGKVSESIDIDDVFDHAWGISALVGPSFALVRGNHLLIALSPGFHIAGLFTGIDRASYSSSAVLFGIGGNAEVAFNLGSSLFFRAAVDVICDFAGSATVDYGRYSYSEETDGTSIWVTPKIGVGFRF